MSHKRIVKKKGKSYGPYIYESYRDPKTGKVKKRYLGKVEQQKSKNKLLITSGVFLALFILAAVFYSTSIYGHEGVLTDSFTKGVLGFFEKSSDVVIGLWNSFGGFFSSSSISGRAIFDLSDLIFSNGTVDGCLNIRLKNGELIPINSTIVVEQNGSIEEFPLSKFLKANNNGSFYTEGVALNGSGEGYGFEGQYILYPEVYFTLLIEEGYVEGNSSSSSEIVGETNNVSESPEDSDSNSEDASEVVESNETISEENSSVEQTVNETGSEDSMGGVENGTDNSGTTIENSTEDSSESTTSSESSGDTVTDVPEITSDITETNTESTETDTEPTETFSAQPAEDSSDSSGSDSSEDSSSGSDSSPADSSSDSDSSSSESTVPITGEVVSSNEIEGTVTALQDFEWNLENQTASFKIGSIGVVGEEDVDYLFLNLDNYGDRVLVSTNYNKTLIGFGEDYLGEEKIVKIDCEDLNIGAVPGVVSVKLIYGETVLAQAEKRVNIDGSIEDVLNETANETLVNVTSVNEAVKQYKAVINRPVKWVKKVKVNKSVTDVSVELPKDADNVSVKTGNEAKEVDKEVEDYEDVVRKTDKADLASGTLITGNVVLDIQEQEGLYEWVYGFFKKFRFAFTGNVVGNVILESEIQNEVVEEVDKKVVNLTKVANQSLTEENVEETEIAVEYYTPAPVANETNVSGGKRIIVNSEDEYNYTDILAYTIVYDVPGMDKIPMNDSRLKLYWYATREDAIAEGYIVENTTNEGVDGENSSVGEGVVEEDNSVSEEVVGSESVEEESNEGEGVEDNMTVVENSSEVVENFSTGILTGNVVADLDGVASVEVVENSGETNLTIEQAVVELLNTSETPNLEQKGLMRFEVSYDAYDLDDDGYVDYVEWIVPHLSTQSYELVLGSGNVSSSNITYNGDYAHLSISSETPYNNLVAYYSFDADSSTTAYDLTGNNNDGTYAGGAYSTESGAIYGKTAEFDGDGDYVNLGNTFTNSWSDEISISTWIYVPTGAVWSNGKGGNIIGKGETDGAMGLIRTSSDNQIAFYLRAVTGGGAALSNIARDEWYHLVGTWNGTNLKIYVNGLLEDSNTLSPTGAPDSDTFRIAENLYYYGFPGNYFNGSIDEVMIFDTALNSTQISEIYNNQSKRFVSEGTQTVKQFNITSGYDKVNVSLDDYRRDLDSNISLRVGEWDVSKGYNLSMDGLVSYYHFDEDSWDTTSGQVIDAMGLNNGTSAGGANTSLTNYPYHRVGEFDGDGDYVSVSDDNSLDLQNNFSISAWVNANDISGPPQGIITKGDYSLKEYDDDYIFEVLGDGTSWSKSGNVGNRPLGLAVYDGKLYVSNLDSNDVYVFDGTSWSKSGDVGDSPRGLAVYDGKLYVANYNSDDVYVFDGTSWSKSGNVGNGPLGLAVYDGKLYVSNYDSNDVYVFDGTSWSKSGDVGNSPYGLAVYDGKLYVANYNSDDVYVFDGTSWSKSGNVGNGPYGLAVYDGKLYVANAGSDDVYVFNGTSWTKSGNVGNGPYGLAVYDGKLYVSNRDSNDVYVFDGTSWTKSGNVGSGPYGLAVYDGKLYVSNAFSDDVYVFSSGESLWASKGSGFEHLTGVVTDSEIKLYVNGEEIASTSHSLTFSSNDLPLLIGKSYGSSQSGYFGGNDENFNGSIDEVMIFNRSLSSDEIKELYTKGRALWNYSDYQNLTDDDNLYYEENYGDAVSAWLDSENDYKGLNDGTLVGGASWDSDVTKRNLTLSLDGDGDYVNVGTLGNFGSQLGSPFTFSSWIKSDSMTIEFLFGVYDRFESSFFIKLNEAPDGTDNQNGKIRAYLSLEGSTPEDGVEGGVNSNTGISDGNWHHLMVKFDSPNNLLEIYIDGVNQTITYVAQTNEGDENYDNFVDDLFIGGGTVNGVLSPEVFKGQMDEVAIWNRALTESEIESIYKNSKERHSNNEFETSVSTTNLLTELKLDSGDDSFYSPFTTTTASGSFLPMSLTSFFGTAEPFVELITPVENVNASSSVNVTINALDTAGASNVTAFVDYGLVSWWRMDDLNATGDGLVDYMERNNGSLVGDMNYTTAGRFGDAMAFDGDEDYVDLIDFNISSQREYTFSAWVYASEQNYNVIYSDSAGGSGGSGAHTCWITNNLECYGSGSITTSSDPINTNEWVHVVFSQAEYTGDSRANVSIYINGVLEGNGLYGVSYVGPLHLGHGVGLTPGPPLQDWNGSMDEVMIFNRSLSPEEVVALYGNQSSKYASFDMPLTQEASSLTAYAMDDEAQVNSTTIGVNFDLTDPTISLNEPLNDSKYVVSSVLLNVSSSEEGNGFIVSNLDNSLVSWWRMDDVSGSTVSDHIGGNDGILNDGASQVDDGKFGKAMEFDGDGDYINTGLTSELGGLTEVTYSVWARFDGNPLEVNSFYVLGSDIETTNIYISEGFYYYALVLNNPYSVVGSNIIAGVNNAWHHYILKWSAEEGYARFYIDGIEVSNASSSSPITYNGNTPLFIGTNYYSSEGWNGSIDEVMIFNRSLSAEEIISLYNATKLEHTETLDDGEHSFSAYTSDVAGNVVTSGVNEFLVDTVGPSIVFNSPDNNSRLNEDYSYVNLSVSDATSGTTFGFAEVNSSPSLVSWWRAEGDATDYIGGNDGTLVDGAGITQSGRFGQGFEFDGDGDYVSVSDDNSLDLQNNFSISAWVNANDISGPPQGILTKGDYSLKEYDDDYIFEVLGDGSTWTKSGNVGERPLGLAVYDGKLYVSNRDSNDVYVFDGTSWTKSGNVGTNPFGLAVYDGKLYVANAGSDDVYVFDGTSWTKSGNVGSGPLGLAVYDGKLYVSNYDSNDVYVFDGTSWSKSGDVGNSPYGLAVYDGKLYVANAGSDDVYVFDGTSWSKSGDVGDSPRGLAVYDGKLYVANYDSNDVYVFDGTSWSKSGDVGNGPYGLAVYDGKLYVSNRDSNDVYVFDGTSWTKSGNVGSGPYGLAVYDGKLYVSNAFSDDVYVFSSGESLWASKGSGFEHLTGVVTDSEIKLYVNGEEIASTSHSLTFSSNDLPLLIGKSYGSSQSGYFGGNDENFNGSIDEVMIFNRSLSSDEIAGLYNSSANKYLRNVTGLDDGSHTITGYAVDEGGVVSVDSVEVSVDTAVPSIEYVDGSTTSGNLSQDYIYVNVSASDSSGNVSIVPNFDNSLVSWWRMDDVSGSTVSDHIGGNDGILNDDASQVDDGKFGKAMEFDGDGDYVSFYDVGTSVSENFTFSLWINSAETVVENSNLLRVGTNLIKTWSVNVGFRTSADDTWLGSAAPLNEWSHVVVVGNGTHVLIYSNGVLGVTEEKTIRTQTNEQIQIGARYTSDYFNGSIDEVMIFNRSLSAEEISALYGNQSTKYFEKNWTGLAEDDFSFEAYAIDSNGNVNSTDLRSYSLDYIDPFVEVLSPENTTYGTSGVDVQVNATDGESDVFSFVDKGLVSWWRAEGDATDYIGGNDGIFVDGAGTTTEGKFGQGFEFDGAGDYVEVGDDDLLDIGTSNLSICSWVKAGTPENSNTGIISRDGTSPRYYVHMYANKIRALIADSSNIVYADSATLINDEEWHLVCSVFDKSNANGITIYLDALDDTDSRTGDLTNIGDLSGMTNPLRIGTRAGNYFNGSIDEVMIFNRSLSVSEIAALYGNQSSKFINTNFDFENDGLKSVTGYVVDSAANLNTSTTYFTREYDSTNVTVCRELWKSNSNYLLQGDILAGSDIINCLEITGTNVTLDFNGFNITGLDLGPSYGVFVTGNDATVEGARIYDFGVGVYLDGATGLEVNNSILSSNSGFDVYLSSGSEGNFTNVSYASETVVVGASLERWMYLIANVTRSGLGTFVEGANVSLRNSVGNALDSQLSGSEGDVDFGLVKRYGNSGGTVTYNAYDTRTTKIPYTAKVVTITQNDSEDLNIPIEYGAYQIDSAQTIGEVYTNINDDSAFANLSDSSRCRYVSNVDLNVTSGGVFNITNCTLEMNSSAISDDKNLIISEGHFYGDYVNITRAENINYNFYALSGSNFTLKNSYVSRVGTDNSDLKRGLEINSTEVVFVNNTFENNMQGLSIFTENATLYDSIIKDSFDLDVGDNLRIAGDNIKLVRFNLSNYALTNGDIAIDANKDAIALDTNYTVVGFGSGATLTRQWSHTVCTSPVLEGAVISVLNASGSSSTIYDNGTADSSGCAEFNLTQYIQNSSGDQYYMDNYSIVVTNDGYYDGSGSISQISAAGGSTSVSMTLIPSAGGENTGDGGGGGGGGGGPAQYEIPVENILLDTDSIAIDMVADEEKERVIKVTNDGVNLSSINIGQTGLSGLLEFDKNSFSLSGGESEDIEIKFKAPNESGVFVGKIYVAGKVIEVSVNVRAHPLLFDAMIVVPDSSKAVPEGDKLDTQVTLIPMGENPRLDVTLNYAIRDFNGKVYMTESETILVDSQKSFKKQFFTGNLATGNYVVTLELIYPNGVATSSSHFEIKGRNLFNANSLLTLLIVAVLGMSVAVGFAIIRYKKHRRHVIKRIRGR